MPSGRCWSAAERAIWLAVALLASLVPAWTSAADAMLPGRVTRVIDGDTIDVLLTSGRIRVRLHGVDAPERDQPGGAEAQQWLQQRLLDRSVLLEPVTQDRYDRLVAILHVDDAIVNRELLRSGNAWAYRSYLRATERMYCEIEAAARRARIGLWAAPPAHAPWEFRDTAGRGPFTDFSASAASDCRRAAGASRGR